jgi:hypothetical protein
MWMYSIPLCPVQVLASTKMAELHFGIAVQMSAAALRTRLLNDGQMTRDLAAQGDCCWQFRYDAAGICPRQHGARTHI